MSSYGRSYGRSYSRKYNNQNKPRTKDGYVKILNPTALAGFMVKRLGPDWYLQENVISCYGEEQLAQFAPQGQYSQCQNIFNLNDFDVKDIKLNLERVEQESQKIYQSKSPQDKRTYSNILKQVTQGHYLENYLIQQGFKDDTRDYMDVISPCGKTVDQKTIRFGQNVDYRVKETLNYMQAKNNQIINWGPQVNQSPYDYVIFYITDGQKYDYHSTYRYDIIV